MRSIKNILIVILTISLLAAGLIAMPDGLWWRRWLAIACLMSYARLIDKWKWDA